MKPRPPLGALALLLFFVPALMVPPARAQQPEPPPAKSPPAKSPPDDDDDWGAGDDDGDDDITISDEDLEIDGPKAVSITGFLRSDWSFWAERFGDNERSGRDAWAKGRQSLDLKLTAKQSFFRLVLSGHMSYDFRFLGEWADHHDLPGGHDDFDRATEDAYLFQLLPREVFAAFTFGPVQLTTGWQIIAWGEGDRFSPMDVVNPRDMREPAPSALEDVRMAVLATSLGVALGNHSLEFIVLHEAYFGLRSPPFGPFSPFNEVVPEQLQTVLAGKDVYFADKEPRFAFEQQQPMLRWVYRGPGIDLGVYTAYVMDKQGVLAIDPATVLSQLGGQRIDMVQEHPYYGVVGTTGAFAWESLLIKWELGSQIEKKYNVGDQESFDLGTVRSTTIETMLGLTYTPIQEVRLGFEFSKSTFVDKPDDLLFPVDAPQFSLSVSWLTLKDRLQIMAAFLLIGVESLDAVGFVATGDVSYQFFDGFKAGLGYIHFYPSKDLGFLSGLGEHDQLLFKVRWDFTII